MANFRSITQIGTSEPFELQVARGHIPGHYGLFKFGNNPSVGDSLETIWAEGGLYSYLTAATVLKVSSSSTDDTSAGTGARTVELSGLDADYNEISELVTLNGQTPVNTKMSLSAARETLIRTQDTSQKRKYEPSQSLVQKKETMTLSIRILKSTNSFKSRNAVITN